MTDDEIVYPAPADVLAIHEALIGPDSRDYATTLRGRGTLEIARGRPRAALVHLEEASEKLAAALGPEHIEVGTTAFFIGSAQLDLGDHEAAVAALSKALELELAAGYGDDIVADSRFHLAQALWGVGEHARARELALAAREGFVAAEVDDAVAEVDDWSADYWF